MSGNIPQLRLDVNDDDAIRDGDPEATAQLLYDWKARLERAFDQLVRETGDARTIRTSDGSSLDKRIEAVEAEEQEFPESYPLVPVYMLGDWTDNFNTDSGLTGLDATSPVTGETITADGQLKIEASWPTQTVNAWVEVARAGGAFLPNDADWAIETAITDLDKSEVGLGANMGVDIHTVGSAAHWYEISDTAAIGFRKEGSNIRIIWDADTLDFDDVLYTPSTATPVYLRIEYDHGTTTLTFKYKGDGESGWTTGGTQNVGAGYWASPMDVFLFLDPQANRGTGSFSGTYDYLTVEYTPSNTGGRYAFIPTTAFDTYKQNHIYVKKTDETYLEIDPTDKVIDNAPLIIWDRDVGVFKMWDGSDYVLLYALPSLHRINDTTYHTGVPDAVEDNFVSFDENGLPKDSDENAASFTRPEHTHAGWSLYRDYFLELV